jgi:hypothetical protein
LIICLSLAAAAAALGHDWIISTIDYVSISDFGSAGINLCVGLVMCVISVCEKLILKEKKHLSV